jgi:hypothetical protein
VKDGSDNSVRHRTKFNIQAGRAKQTNNPHSFQELTNHCDPISNKAQNLTTFEPSENTELFYPLQLSYNTKSFFKKKGTGNRERIPTLEDCAKCPPLMRLQIEHEKKRKKKNVSKSPRTRYKTAPPPTVCVRSMYESGASSFPFPSRPFCRC